MSNIHSNYSRILASCPLITSNFHLEIKLPPSPGYKERHRINIMVTITSYILKENKNDDCKNKTYVFHFTHAI